MRARKTWLVSAATISALAACNSGDGIDESGTVFDGIGLQDTVTLVGNEPFWELEIRPGAAGQHLARYTNPENSDGSEFEMSRFAGNNGLGFSGDLAGRPVIAAITPGECSDSMSDRIYPFVATVTIGEVKLRGCGHTSRVPYSGPPAP